MASAVSPISFGQAFDAEFGKRTAGLSPLEVPLFRALRSTLVGMSSKFHIEEYHGTRCQVRFSGDGSFARTHARCELSDLMIVVFSTTMRQARLTYLQAKSQRGPVVWPSIYPYSANLEQWFLLSARPPIAGCGNFNPPANLLRRALLPSVGSFGFFFEHTRRGFQLFYASADALAPLPKYKLRRGRSVPPNRCGRRVVAGYSECYAACGNVAFASNLYAMQIGTPVEGEIQRWVASILSSQSGALARELVETLEFGGDQRLDAAAPNQGSGGFGAKSLVLIRTETSKEDQASVLFE